MLEKKKGGKPTSTDSPSKKARRDADEPNGAGLSAGAASSRDPPNITRKDQMVESGTVDANDDESMPPTSKVQGISSVTVGYGAADNTGKVICMQSY